MEGANHKIITSNLQAMIRGWGKDMIRGWGKDNTDPNPKTQSVQ
jgi:hypothetical protein